MLLTLLIIIFILYVHLCMYFTYAYVMYTHKFCIYVHVSVEKNLIAHHVTPIGIYTLLILKTFHGANETNSEL